MQSHVSRVRTSYWKSVTNPFLLSEMVAKRMTDIEKNLCDLQRSLDACQIELASENAIFEERLNSLVGETAKTLAKEFQGGL